MSVLDTNLDGGKEVLFGDWGQRDCKFRGPEDGQTMVCLRNRKATKREKRDEIRKEGRVPKRQASVPWSLHFRQGAVGSH